MNKNEMSGKITAHKVGKGEIISVPCATSGNSWYCKDGHRYESKVSTLGI